MASFFNITCKGLNGIIWCDDNSVGSDIIIVSRLFDSWIIDDDDFMVDVRLDCNELPQIVPSFSLVVASIRLEYALWIVLSNEISFSSFKIVDNGFVSILFERTIAEIVEFSVNGLITTVGIDSDLSGKSIAWIFDGLDIGDDTDFGIVVVSSVKSAP